MQKPVTATVSDVRRLAVTRQHLAGELQGGPAEENILSAVRDIAFVQWDPIAVVAPSHIIALWNRVGNFNPADLDRLMWTERKLLLHWANFAASIVLAEDYPIYYSMMKRYPESLSSSWGKQREAARKFIAGHRELGQSIVRQLKDGPVQIAQFREYVRTKRNSDGWSSGSEVSTMLFHLELSGKIMVVGRTGNQNVWGLCEDFLPKWVEKRELDEAKLERVEAERAIRSLGTASRQEINYYFPRGRYQNLKKALAGLAADSTITPVHVDGKRGREERYIHAEDVNLIETLHDNWEPRMSLLPPFDNLICGRQRTNRVFGFDYSHEMFLPEKKRKYGYYVLPILWGENMIGRIDPCLDRQEEKLLINSVHAEPGAPADRDTAGKIADKIAQLAEFLGATEVVYTASVPHAWKKELR